MKSSKDSIDLFWSYLVMYGPNEAKVGIRGIRSDAPKEAIDAFLFWYRDQHRYKNGRMMCTTDDRVLKLIIDVDDYDDNVYSSTDVNDNDNTDDTEGRKDEPSSIIRSMDCSFA